MKKIGFFFSRHKFWATILLIMTIWVGYDILTYISYEQFEEEMLAFMVEQYFSGEQQSVELGLERTTTIVWEQSQPLFSSGELSPTKIWQYKNGELIALTHEPIISDTGYMRVHLKIRGASWNHTRVRMEIGMTCGRTCGEGSLYSITRDWEGDWHRTLKRHLWIS